MTEYDYSGAGHRRYIATQNRIAKWVHHTESAPQLSNPFLPSSDSGSRSSYATSTHFPHRPPTKRTHHTRRSSQVPSPYTIYDSPSTPSSSSSRSSYRSYSYSPPASTVAPSHSISQAPPTQQFHRSSHHSSGHGHHTHAQRSSHHSHTGQQHHTQVYPSPQHHTHAHHRPPTSTYIISTPPPPSGHTYRTRGVIILPRPGTTPQVVFY